MRNDHALLNEIQHSLKVGAAAIGQRHRQWRDPKIALTHRDNPVEGCTVFIQFVEEQKTGQPERSDARPDSDKLASNPRGGAYHQDHGIYCSQGHDRLSKQVQRPGRIDEIDRSVIPGTTEETGAD